MAFNLIKVSGDYYVGFGSKGELIVPTHSTSLSEVPIRVSGCAKILNIMFPGTLTKFIPTRNLWISGSLRAPRPPLPSSLETSWWGTFAAITAVIAIPNISIHQQKSISHLN